MHSWNSSRLHERAECAMLERDGKTFIFVVVWVGKKGMELFWSFDNNNTKLKCHYGFNKFYIERRGRWGNCAATYLRFYYILLCNHADIASYIKWNFMNHKLCNVIFSLDELALAQHLSITSKISIWRKFPLVKEFEITNMRAKKMNNLNPERHDKLQF